MASAGVPSEVVVQLLLTHCLSLLPLFVVVLCLVLGLLFSFLCPSFAVIFLGKGELVALLYMSS